MVLFTNFAIGVLGGLTTNAIISATKNEASKIDTAYDAALKRTVDWYENKYDDQYGTRNNRFFNYLIADEALEKILLNENPMPANEIAARLEKEHQCQFPPAIIATFQSHLIDELKSDPVTAPLLRAIRNSSRFKQISNNTGRTAANTGTTADIATQILDELRKLTGSTAPPASPGSTGFEPLDRHVLYTAFKNRELDVIPVKYISDKTDGPQYLNLAAVFFELSASLSTGDSRMPEGETTGTAGNLKEFSRPLQLLWPHIWKYLQEKKISPAGFDDPEEKKNTIKNLCDAIEPYGFGNGEILETAQFQKICGTLCQDLDTDMDSVVARLHFLVRESLPSAPVLSLLKAPCSALVKGDAGIGKSTLLRKMAIDLFECLDQKDTPSAPVPLFVRLDQIAEYLSADQPVDQARQSLLEYVCAHWKKDLTSAQLTVPAIESYTGELQFIFDGLDEIPTPELRKKLIETSASLTQRDGWHVIVTSRPAAIEDIWLRNVDFPMVELAELATGQVHDFAKNFFHIYHGGHTEKGNTDARSFLDRLDETKPAQAFAANPLYLTVMMLMQKLHKVLPRRRLDLYKAFLNMLLLQRADTMAAGRHADKPVFEFKLTDRPTIRWSEDDYIPLLQQMAYLAHCDTDDTVSITTECVIESARICFPDLPLHQPGREKLAGCFLDWADEKLGLMVFRGRFRGFSHRAIQEYLAAMRLADFDEKQEIVDFWKEKIHSDPNLWQDIARLLICEIRKKRFLFDYLKEQWTTDISTTDDPRIITVISAVYDDLQGFYGKGGSIDPLREKIVKALIRRRDRSHEEPALFVACGDGLGQLDEPRIDFADPPMVVLNPSGAFQMGDEENDDGKPFHPVELSPYAIGRYPVTNREFAAFIADGGYENETCWFDDTLPVPYDGREFLANLDVRLPADWNGKRFGHHRPLAPVVSVTWYEAMAYCHWWTLRHGPAWCETHGIDGGVTLRLPTEAEWEYAARGMNRRAYPWGDTQQPDLERCNTDNDYDVTTSIGSFPRGFTPAGVTDLAGNVWEWCLDWYDKDYYQNSPRKDPSGPPEGLSKLLRGGSWFNLHYIARCAHRFRINPNERDIIIGFRCVRTVK